MKEIKKEDVVNLSYKDITNLILEQEKKGINTLELFTRIVNLLELPSSTIENKIGDYYTSLTTDKRFILVDGLWDLRKRHTSDKIIVDSMEDDDMESIVDSEEEPIVEDEYNDYDSDDQNIDDDYDEPDNDDDDLADLVVLDEEDLN